MSGKQLVVGMMLTGASLAAHAAATAGSVPDVRSACRATLSVQDARTLAAASPNARGFAENLHATLTTQVVRSTAASAYVRVLAAEPKQAAAEVGVYTVNLHTGRVTDDDQEPAEDAGTAAVRARLMAKHCGAK